MYRAGDMMESISILMGVLQGLGIMAYIMGVIALVIPYVVTGYMIMCIGRKARLVDDWMPFVPIARQLYQMQIADCPWWYIFLFQGCFVNGAVMAVLILIFGAVFKSAVLAVLVIIVYAIATLVFTFLYYRQYYIRFGFNPNAAWIEIIWTFGLVRTVLLVLLAFSDAIRFRGLGELANDVYPVPSGGGQRSEIPIGAAGAGRRGAAVCGVSGKYSGASFDISDGAPVIFGRSSTDANIVFDQFETDISRKHCSVKYDSMSDQFIVTDFSTNGTYMESGEMFTPNQPKSVERGSIIYLGKNKKNSFRLG